MIVCIVSLYLIVLHTYMYMYIHQACKQVHTVRAGSFAGRTMCSTYILLYQAIVSYFE